MTLPDLSEAVRCSDRVRIVGAGSRLRWLPKWDGETLQAPAGVIAHDVDDQVVEAWAGTRVEELVSVLARHGQCLPLARGVHETCSQSYGTVGGLLATNLPHALSAQCGSVRDWVLGMTIVRADGTVAKCGSKAVKSVAGYDVHKFFVGSRGTLGAIVSAVLRTYPLAALPVPTIEIVSDEEPNYVARTMRADFDSVVQSTKGLTAFDRASCTFWTSLEPQLPVESWLISQGGAIERTQQPDKLETNARQVFDPTKKFAPGWIE